MEMEKQLEWLYAEYESHIKQYAAIKDRVEKIAATIISYGGTVPTLDQIHKEGLDISAVLTGASENTYPQNGTWKEKILHTLKRYGRPLTASEIADHISDAEKIKGVMPSNIHNVISVTTSKMGVDKEIAVDKSQFKNRYSLLSS